MELIKRISLIILLSGTLWTIPYFRIVSIGDRPEIVEEKLGKPTYIARDEVQKNLTGEVYELWIYEYPIERYIIEVVIENGKVIDVRERFLGVGGGVK